jgi:hypothetical protein
MSNNIYDSDENAAIEYAKFLINQRKEFLKNYREEFLQLVKYGETLMSSLAIIAGFGFTAFQYINNQIIFFIGEGLVVFSILYLIYRTKSYVAGQPISTESWINNSIPKVAEIKSALIEGENNKIKELAEEFRRDIYDVSKEMPPLKASKEISSDLSKSFLLGTLGIILIFLSFARFC